MNKHSKGQVSLWIPIVGGIATVIASLAGAWATTNSTIYEVRQDVAVVEEREMNHYSEIQRQLETIDDKIDRLLRTAI